MLGRFGRSLKRSGSSDFDLCFGVLGLCWEVLCVLDCIWDLCVRFGRCLCIVDLGG